MDGKSESPMTGTAPSNEQRTKRWRWILIVTVLVVAVGGYLWVTQLQPFLYATEAYIYGFPLIRMDLTKEASTSATAGELIAPVNQLSVMTHYPDVSFRAVARTSLDTLFAVF